MTDPSTLRWGSHGGGDLSLTKVSWYLDIYGWKVGTWSSRFRRKKHAEIVYGYKPSYSQAR